MKQISKTMRLFSAILFVVLFGVGLWNLYKNDQAEQTRLRENYMKIEAEITFAGKRGTAYRTKALLFVTYSYADKNYTATITRPYRKEEYYKKGDKITIYINPNNPEEIKYLVSP